MPALVIFRRRWHMATDMLPLPGIGGGVVHVIWLVVFGALVGRYNILSEDCVLKGGAHQGGIQLQVVAGAFLAIYGASLLGEIALTWVGFQGTPLEVQRRAASVPLLYLMSVLWLLQVVFMVYGTVVSHTVSPSCWSPSRGAAVIRVIKAMVYSTWAFTTLLGLMVLLIYNAYHNPDKMKAWERRIACWAWLCGCAKTVAQKDQSDNDPLPKITQWVSGLLGGVDLVPSDITCALVLTAAAQQQRRRMRVKRALEPVLASSMSDASSRASSLGPSNMSPSMNRSTRTGKRVTDLDNVSEASETMSAEAGDDEAEGAPVKQRRILGEDGQLTPAKSGEAPVAMPVNYPQHLKDKVASQYQGAAQAMTSSHGSSRPGSSRHHAAAVGGDLQQQASPPVELAGLGQASSLPADWQQGQPPFVEGKPALLPTSRDIELAGRQSKLTLSNASQQGHAAAVQERETSQPSLGSHRVPSVAATAPGGYAGGYKPYLDGMETGVRPTLPAQRQESTESQVSVEFVTPFAALASTPQPPSPQEQETSRGVPRVVSLSQVDPAAVERTAQAAALEDGRRGALEVETVLEAEQAQAASQAGLGTTGPSTRRAESFVTADEARDELKDLGQAPPATAGLLQAGLNEPGGSLGAPSELCLANVTKSGAIVDALGVAIRESHDPDLRRAGDSPEAGEGRGHMSLDGVPIDRQISVKFPTVITPTGAAEDLRLEIPNMTPKEAAERYAGNRPPVDLDILEEAQRYVKYAVAVYAVMPLTLDPNKGACCRSPCTCGLCASKVITAPSITQEIVKLTGLPEDDVLFWSHDNTALSHIPYMICLDRELKTIILALRGTVSVADLVTDAVVHPEPMDDWLPDDVLKKHGRLHNTFGHGGMVAAANSIFQDLDGNGILRTLLHGEDYQQQSDEPSGQGVGAKMEKALDCRGYKLVVTGHSLGAGTAALISLKLKGRFPGVHCWAFNPPGGLVSRNLNRVMEGFCHSIVVGKDAVSRASVNNLSRLMDEMVTSLARCRCHKLRILFSGFWNSERRPPAEELFCSYRKIPSEAKALLERYHMAQDLKGRALNMYPPGKIVFLRPIKVLGKRERDAGGRRVKKRWDAVWVTPHEVIGEGILVSKRMMEDHLSDRALVPALRWSTEHHPQRQAQPKVERDAKAKNAHDFQKEASQMLDVAAKTGPSVTRTA